MDYKLFFGIKRFVRPPMQVRCGGVEAAEFIFKKIIFSGRLLYKIRYTALPSMVKLYRTALIAILTLPILSGCVSRRACEENISYLVDKLNREKASGNEEIGLLEVKVKERGRAIGDITGRYIKLMDQHDISEAKLGRLTSDLQALQRDMTELKLVIFSNFKGSQANEMMLKLNEMQRRVQEILRKSGEPLPSAPAATPAVIQEQAPETDPADKL